MSLYYAIEDKYKDPKTPPKRHHDAPETSPPRPEDAPKTPPKTSPEPAK